MLCHITYTNVVCILFLNGRIEWPSQHDHEASFFNLLRIGLYQSSNFQTSQLPIVWANEESGMHE
jgi:hypothetical protein